MIWKAQNLNHYYTQTIQDQNKRWAIYVETGEQDCAAIHIFHLPCLSNQGVGVTASPQTLIDPGTGLQLEVVYHATTLSGLQFWTFALYCHFLVLDKGVSFFDGEYKIRSQ